MKKTKVLMYGPSLAQGGIATFLEAYRKYLEVDYNVRYIPTYSGKNIVIDSIIFFYAIIYTIFCVIANKDTIFHIHTATKGSFFRKKILANIANTFNGKVVMHIHSGNFVEFIENSKDKKRDAIIKTLNRVDKVIVLSNSWKKEFEQYIEVDKLMRLYNPCVKVIEEYKQKTNEKLNIVYLGKINKNKGVYDLIDAISNLKSKKAVLNIYGTGESDKLNKIINNKQIEDKVKVHGWIAHDKVYDVFSQSDVLVLPSYYEGMPMVVLEAMGYGLPVISTCVGGIPELIHNNENGYLIKPGDVNELTKKLEILIEDEQLRNHMGQKSLKYVKENFNMKHISKQIQELYDELLYQ